MTTSPTPCRFCGSYHGVRCPSVAAIEYHPDGTVRRVEFVQPLARAVGPGPQILPQPPVTSVTAEPVVADLMKRFSADPQPWTPSHGVQLALPPDLRYQLRN